MLHRFLILMVFLLTLPFHAKAEELTVHAIMAADLKPVAAEVDSAHHATARARIGGTITELKVSEGAEVKRGDVLAIINDPKQPLAIDAMEARLKSLEHERAQAAADVKRFTPLAKSGTISKLRMEELNTRLSMLDDSVHALRAERDNAITQRNEGHVLAPMDGKVLTLPTPQGNVIMPGETVAELTAGDLILKIRVPERHARYLKKDMELRIVSKAADGSDAVSMGKVVKIYPEIQEGRITADLSVEDIAHLYVGEQMTAYVPAARRKAIYIPPSAVTRRYGLNYVTLKSGVEAVVELGLEDDHGVEVLSGLNEGDVLVTP